jgi:hypothetical protein
MRKIKQNIWGNWNGYEGRSRVQEFGTDDIASAYWLLTGDVDFDAGYSPEWLAKCKEAIKSV